MVHGKWCLYRFGDFNNRWIYVFCMVDISTLEWVSINNLMINQHDGGALCGHDGFFLLKAGGQYNMYRAIGILVRRLPSFWGYFLFD